ncbi:lectin-like domain-containing protein, partial [Liquorilactobacillus sucicola]
MKDSKLHYKMYKAGKRWIFAGITIITIGIGVAGYETPIHADTQENVAKTSTSSAENTKVDSTRVSSSTSTYSAKDATDTAVTSSSASSNEATDASTSSGVSSAEPDSAPLSSSEASSTKATSESTNSEASSTKANSTSISGDTTSTKVDSASTSSESTSAKASSTKADSASISGDTTSTKVDSASTSSESTSAKASSTKTDSASTSGDTTSTNNTEKNNNTAQISYKDLIQQFYRTESTSRDAVNLTQTHVNQKNFLDYFELNGQRDSDGNLIDVKYDPETGIVTLTPNEQDKVGNFALKSKIDMNSNFTLVGQVNLGSDPSGADGIGFAFHNGNTTDIGNSGGNLGIGGLQNAVGFKLDTWSNGYQAPSSDQDGSQIDPTNSNAFGWNGDSMSAPYGTFVKTTDKTIKTQDGSLVQRWWAEDTDTPQSLSKKDIDGKFHDFIVNYDGKTRNLTISYTQTDGNVLKWSTNVSSSYQAMALIVSASTGWAKNLQQFKLTSFDFTQAATVNVKYVDTTGNTLATSEVVYPDGPYKSASFETKKLDIPNYKFFKMGDNETTGVSIPVEDKDPEKIIQIGTLNQPGDNGTVIYV